VRAIGGKVDSRKNAFSGVKTQKKEKGSKKKTLKGEFAYSEHEKASD